MLRNGGDLVRVVCWFSCGATSAVAAHLAVWNASVLWPGREVEVVYIDTGSEHPDNMRFLRDFEALLGVPIKIIRSSEYVDTWDVFDRTRWLIGPQGARCTTELKKVPRMAYQRVDDIQVFGFDRNEQKRVERFVAENPEVKLYAPLIEHGLTKADCLASLKSLKIEPPLMYRLGFRNANCLGCVKGGMGYWNKIRRHFPEVFAKMAAMERKLDVAICKREVPGRERIRVFLDELDPNAGRADESVGDCNIFCAAAPKES